MKVKEVDRTANVAWSPATHHPIYLAAGTAAQQLDATFSTNAALEVYSLNLAEHGTQMELVGSIPSDFRFHKLVWGSYGMPDSDLPSGVLIGGTDNGNIFIWNCAELIAKNDCLIHTIDQHNGAVTALDINPFQSNLLASGASDSEIFIWDLNNPEKPMTPGSKSQPPDDVTCIKWNQQVQHILASTYAGRCVVWDLRKNEPIIKVSDSMSRIKSKLVTWHPEVATQLCLASEDDHTPVIQLWDLRFATSPLKLLENHQRGILSMAWCPHDPDLLLSCGKDNRILCWNPNNQAQMGEMSPFPVCNQTDQVVYELPTSNQWSFDVQWCPRNPAVISSCSFDGHISIYSLMGGKSAPQNANRVAEAFSSDPFSGQTAQSQSSTTAETTTAFKKAPKWLRRPVGASFAFGGKLVSFENVKSETPQQATNKVAYISQVITEEELVVRSNQLENALANKMYAEFCSLKIANSKDQVDENIWNFLKVHFEKDPRSQYLQLLGFNSGELAKKVSTFVDSHKEPDSQSDLSDVSADTLPEMLATLDTNVGSPDQPGVEGAATDAFEEIAAHEKEVQLDDLPLPISVNDECEGLITQALLTANFEVAVDVCLNNNKVAEAIILAFAGGADLLRRTQKRFFQKSKSNLNRLISSVVTKDFEHIVRHCEIENWKEALAVSLTYAKAEEFSGLCDILGSRLETEKDGELAANACLCYICAGNVTRLVQCCSKMTTNNTSDSLQDLVEKVMILRKAVETASGRPYDMLSETLAQKLSQYSGLLAAQGNLQTAINYLGSSNQVPLCILRDRLYEALGQTGMQRAGKPFQVIDVKAQGTRAQPQPTSHTSQTYQRQRTPSGFHQAQAGGPLQTTTTATSTYYSQNQYTGVPYNYPSHSQPDTTYNQPQTVYSSQAQSAASSVPGISPTALSKGPLSNRYPACPSSTPYNPYGGATDQYTAYSSANYPTSQAQPVTSQPALYDPSSMADQQQTPGAPYRASADQAPVPAYQLHKPANAWNDPPAVHPKKAETKFKEPSAITAPVVGVPENQQIDQGAPGAPSYSTANLYNPQQYQQQIQQQQQQVTAKSKEPPKPVEKPPVPAEHAVLKEVFDNLANQCTSTATNAQTKRKLDDVHRKLEVLYDKLRDQMLSGNVVLGLHQIVQAIQQYDYQTGLGCHTQMISQGNFSEISSFMPGIKMLLQTALQLQVYIQ